MIPLLEDIKRLLLREWDPIGVRDIPGAADEYDGYALQIFTMLKSGASEPGIADYLDRAQGEHMALELTRERNRRIAAAIVRLHGS